MKHKTHVSIGKRYRYTWNDGATVCFTVDKIDIDKGKIFVTFDNGATNFASIGSPFESQCIADF